mgnify:CR=1
ETCRKLSKQQSSTEIYGYLKKCGLNTNKEMDTQKEILSLLVCSL